MAFETQGELMTALNALPLTNEQKRTTICAWVGHSRVQNAFLGQFTCNRCGALVGDSLAGVYDATNVVIIGHDCATCRTNYAALDWRDLLFTDDPFVKP